MKPNVDECEECGEIRHLTPTVYGNICQTCEEKWEETEREIEEE